jgi:hypothetical protein
VVKPRSIRNNRNESAPADFHSSLLSTIN